MLTLSETVSRNIDPRGLLTSLFSSMSSVSLRPSKQHNFQVKLLIVTSWTLGLAEGIIDDTCPVLVSIYIFQFILLLQ